MPFFRRVRRTSAHDPTTTENHETPELAEAPEHSTDDTDPPAGTLVARVLTVLAGLFLLVVLLAPNQIGQLTPGAFLRIPAEGIVGVALLLVLPSRARWVVALLGGVVLGLLTVVKIIDMGFFAVLSRPFDPVLDWILFDDAVDFLTDAAGRAGAIGAVVAAAALTVAVIAMVTLAVRRMTRVVVQHRSIATWAVATLTPVWVVCAVLGTAVTPAFTIAAASTADLVRDRAIQVSAGLRDEQAFADAASVDPFRDTPADQLLTGLRGKDVVIAFVESYGRDAVEDPEFAPQVGAVLDEGTRRLGAAGYASRSAFLTSSTTGSGSGLAHATLLSGLWIDSNQRWRTLVSSDRTTLTSAFQRANWRTVGVMPGNTRAWPEGAFYHFDQVYDSRNMGYKGPSFSWATMTDQYVLSAFGRDEHAKPNRGPLMAQITLVSSHAPWDPIPRLVDWGAVGDGSVFAPMATEGDPPDVVWSDPARVRAEYRRSIEYSLDSLISYVQTYGDDNLVLVFLGDHQPLPLVTGEGASRDVPITIVARDPAVLDRVAGWGWQDGLRPGPQAPVWRMDAFRDRFLTAFGPQADPPTSPSVPNR